MAIYRKIYSENDVRDATTYKEDLYDFYLHDASIIKITELTPDRQALHPFFDMSDDTGVDVEAL